MLHEVRRQEANEIGLFDMLGNAKEWCDGRRRFQGEEESVKTMLARIRRGDMGLDAKALSDYKPRPISNWLKGEEDMKPIRGGNYTSEPDDCRPSRRFWDTGTHLSAACIGFRIVALPR